MSELLLPVGVPMGVHRDGEDNTARWGQIGQSRGSNIIEYRYYAGWSLAFATQREPELADLIGISEIDEPEEVVNSLVRWNLAWKIDPDAPLDRRLRLLSMLRILPMAIGWGNDPTAQDSDAAWLLRSVRGDREVRCSQLAYQLYFRSRVDSIVSAVQDFGHDTEHCTTVLLRLLPRVLSGGLCYLDLSEPSEWWQ